MTKAKRWLDELPLESSERELLLVGKAARPADGAIDANWRALCVALSTTAAASVVVTGAAANSASSSPSVVAATSAKVGSSIVVSKAASAGLLVVITKSLAVGLAVGFAVMGAGAMAEHMSADKEPRAAVKKTVATSTAPRPSAGSMPTPNVAPADSIASAPAQLPRGSSSSLPPSRERFSSSPTPGPAPTPVVAAAAAAVSPEEKAASLLQQARELAELKRLIDNGATSEALRRLDKDFRANTVSALSEERDALYVQALAGAQRSQEARAFARQFLIRYPHSPYFEAMHQLLDKE